MQNKNKLIMFLILFLYCFSPTFKFVEIASSLIVFAFVLFLSFIKKPFFLVKINVHIIYSLIVFFILGLYSWLIQLTLYNETLPSDNAIFFRLMINNFIYILFGYAFVCFFQKNITFDSFLKTMTSVIMINSIVILFSGFFPEFKDFIEVILSQQYESNINYAESFRLRGLSASGGFALSVVIVIGVIFSIFLNFNSLLSTKKTFAIIFTMASSQIFIARTGLFMSVILFLFWLLYVIFFKRDRLSILLMIVLGAVVLSIASTIFSAKLASILPWVMEMFDNFLHGKGLRTNSTDELMSMYNVPSDFMRIILGFGFFEADISYRSDSGFIKTLYSIGLIGLSLYLYHAYFLLYYLPVKFRKYRFMFYLIFVSMMIMELKGPVFYQNYTSRVVFILYALGLYAKSISMDKYSILARK